MSQAFFRKILVRHGRPLRAEYEEPFAYLLSSNKYSLRGSHKSTIVALRGQYSNLLGLLIDLVPRDQHR